MRLLSNYINHSILIDKSPVWLAQREGRAKDGIDKTEPAIIKMLDLSRDKKERIFSEHIAELSIVPVAISYELDPCDDLKAKELYEIDRSGTYDKALNEDIISIGRGIAGQKGKVRVSFGNPIMSNLSDSMAVSQEIDRQIIQMYQLYPNNIVAHQLAYPDDKLTSDTSNKKLKVASDYNLTFSSSGSHETIFMINNKSGAILTRDGGRIIAVKKVAKTDIQIHTITQGTIKPRVKI